MSQSLSRWTGSVLPATRGVGWLAALSLHHATLFYKSSRLEFRAVLLCWSGVLALLRRGRCPPGCPGCAWSAPGTGHSLAVTACGQLAKQASPLRLP